MQTTTWGKRERSLLKRYVKTFPSQAAACRKLDIPTSTLSRWLDGAKPNKPDGVLRCISAALQIAVMLSEKPKRVRAVK